jgi:hypothetical protein
MMERSSALRLVQAYDFAARMHTDQRRKGARAEPYINHLTEVAALVGEGNDGGDIDIIVAAILHDTIEDTETTLEELTEKFGGRVAELVSEVTEDKSLSKAERKRLQVDRSANASVGAKIIKLADKISNLRALASSPPVDWSEARRWKYLAWARRVVAGCRGANAWLEGEFDAAANALGQPRARLRGPEPQAGRSPGAHSAYFESDGTLIIEWYNFGEFAPYESADMLSFSEAAQEELAIRLGCETEQVEILRWLAERFTTYWAVKEWATTEGLVFSHSVDFMP